MLAESMVLGWKELVSAGSGLPISERGFVSGGGLGLMEGGWGSGLGLGGGLVDVRVVSLHDEHVVVEVGV